MPTEAKKKKYQSIAILLKNTYGLEFNREFMFAKEIKRWRLDFALPCCKLGIEIEGGSWAGGGHTRGSGFARDMEKYNNANIKGWHILRFTPQEVDNLKFLTHIRQYLHNFPCTHTRAQSELY